jgi:hypothetical protein
MQGFITFLIAQMKLVGINVVNDRPPLIAPQNPQGNGVVSLSIFTNKDKASSDLEFLRESDERVDSSSQGSIRRRSRQACSPIDRGHHACP